MRTVEVDGQSWGDGWVVVDRDGKLWRLVFVQSTWGPEKDAWVWHEFGVEVDHPIDDPAIVRPLTKVWPPEAKPAAKRRVPDTEPDPRSGRQG